MSEEQETHMLTGAYALGAVDELEAARVRELLRTSPEAAAEVRSFTETAARLADAEACLAAAEARAVAAEGELVATKKALFEARSEGGELRRMLAAWEAMRLERGGVPGVL